MGKIKEWIFKGGAKLRFTEPTGDPADELVGSDFYLPHPGAQADMVNASAPASARVFFGGMDWGYKSDPLVFVPFKGDKDGS